MIFEYHKKRKLFVATFKSFLVLVLTCSLVACGGGGGDGGDSTSLAASVKLADCFQVNTQNAFRMSIVHSPASYQSGISTGFSTVSASPFISPTTGLALSTPVSGTFSYADSIYDTSYRQTTYKSISATAKNRVGKAFIAGTNSLSPIAYDNDSYYAITSSRMTFLGSTALGTQGMVISEIEDTSFNLLLAIGEKSVVTNTLTFSPTTPTTDGTISKTITYIAQEDVSTPAGVFKNSCKLDVEVKTITTNPLDPFSTTVTSTIWVAPAWGVIKEVATHSFSDGRIPSVATRSRQVTNILRGSL
jgi:hypothetical protein